MAVEETRWGILYCPKHGHSRRWTKIEKCLKERGVSYDFVQSESAGGVERLMRMLVNNGYKTIILVGGDTALNDAVNCLMEFPQEQRDTVSLGIIPNGLVNDFARYWGFTEADDEQTIDWLIRQRVRKVDLGSIRYTNRKGEICQRYFINCANIGFTASVMRLRRQTRRILWSQTLSFIISSLLLLFRRMEYKMCLHINSETINRKVMTVCIGSGPGYGQTPNAVPYNGLLDVSVVYHPEVLQLFGGVYLLLTGKFLNYKRVRPYRTQEVRVEESRHAMVSCDGRPIDTPEGAYQITIEQEVINILIP